MNIYILALSDLQSRSCSRFVVRNHGRLRREVNKETVANDECSDVYSVHSMFAAGLVPAGANFKSRGGCQLNTHQPPESGVSALYT